jgi:hypothetical protein
MKKKPFQFTPWAVFLVAVFLSGASPQKFQHLSAPTYYLAIEVKECTAREVRIYGATNLPPGSVIGLSTSEFVGEIGWKDYSEEAFATVDAHGFFQGTVHSKAGLSFRSNLIASAAFMPYRPTQPAKVLEIVGKKGEHLGYFENPQVGYESGNYRTLGTIARVGECGPN